MTSFRYEVSPAKVATLTFCRPDRLNSLTFQIYLDLKNEFARLSHDANVRAIILTGEGRAFCSGGDVDDIIGELFSRDMAGLVDFTRATGALIREMRACRKPIIGAINGTAVGAGAVMALACDFRIASENAKFGFIFPQVGLAGADMGAAFLLPRVVGLGRASELLFTGDIIDAKRANEIGFLTKITTADALLQEATSLAERLASGPAFAHGMTKQMLESEYTMSLDQAIEAEAQAQAVCMMHPDFRAAFDAWKEKRPTKFAGATIDFIRRPDRAPEKNSTSKPGT
jgi:enoyl-CoA hydratase/carnithine racemase